MKIENVSAWQKLSHKQKRSAKVTVNGRKLRLIEYADELARKLPDIFDSTDNMKAVNHKKLMRESMTDSGTEGVHKYYNGVLKMHNDQLLLLSELNRKVKEETERLNMENNKKAANHVEHSGLKKELPANVDEPNENLS